MLFTRFVYEENEEYWGHEWHKVKVKINMRIFGALMERTARRKRKLKGEHVETGIQKMKGGCLGLLRMLFISVFQAAKWCHRCLHQQSETLHVCFLMWKINAYSDRETKNSEVTFFKQRALLILNRSNFQDSFREWSHVSVCYFPKDYPKNTTRKKSYFPHVLPCTKSPPKSVFYSRIKQNPLVIY